MTYCFYLFAVKLTGPSGVTSGNGSVLVYVNDSWSLVCDENFDDNSARKICKELGFADGRALCCSAFGASGVRLKF